MKRFIFSAIALVIAATSCTESGLIDAPEFYGNAIVFDTYIGKAPITKAENVDANYLKGFVSDASGTVVSSSTIVDGVQVYAFKAPKGESSPNSVDYESAYLNGHLTWNGNSNTSGIWQYQIKSGDTWTNDDPYMPTGNDLAFAAYNLDAEGCMTFKDHSFTEFTYTVPAVVANQKDLLLTPLTFVSENANEDTSVPLHFYHLLSRVSFKILSTGGSDTEIKISAITLHARFINSGKVDMSSSTTKPAILPIKENYVDSYSFFGNGDLFTISNSDCAEGVPGKGAQPIYANKKENDNTFVGNQRNRYMMIMPGQVGNIADLEDVDYDGDILELITRPYIEVTYYLGRSETPNIAKVPLLDSNGNNWDFKAGKAYEFIFKIATSAIEFSATVVEDGWDEQTPNPIN